MKTNPAKIPVEVDNFLDCGLSNDSRFIERKFGHEVKCMWKNETLVENYIGLN